MTVASTASKISYTGNGVTTVFAFPYPFIAASDMKVYVAGVLKTITTDYTVSGTAPYPAGANITFVSPPANLAAVLLSRVRPYTQSLDLVENDPLPAEQVELLLGDHMVMLTQQLNEVLSRVPQLAVTSTFSGLTMPDPVAGTILGFNAGGTDFTTYTAASLNLLTAFYQNGSGNVSIGRPGSVTAGFKLDINGNLWVQNTASINTGGDVTGTDSINTYAQLDAYQSNSAMGAVGASAVPGISASTSRGTGAVPLINLTADLIGGLTCYGYSGASPGYNAHAAVMGRMVGATAANLGGQLELYTKIDNGALTLALTITNAQAATFAGAIAAPSLAVSSSTIPANGLYLPAANNPGIAANTLLVAQFASAASAVDSFLFTSGAAGTPGTITMAAQGSDTNIDIAITPKGSGTLKATSFTPTSTTLPSNGMYLRTTNEVGVAAAGSVVLRIISTGGASGVNYLAFNAGVTTAAPSITALGETNIGLQLSSNGTGAVSLYTNNNAAKQFEITHTASASSYWSFTGGAGGATLVQSVGGSDANVGLQFSAKGNAGIDFFSNGARQFRVANNATAVNYLQAVGTATTGSPALLALGSDAAVTLTLGSLGAGAIQFLTNTNATKQFEILHTASAVNYFSMSGNATTLAPSLSVLGSDASISMILAAKGAAGSLVFFTNSNNRASIDGTGNLILGTAALATTATAGFAWLTSSAGPPTGAATAPYTNAAAFHYDSTNNKIYVRCGGTWRSTAALT